MAPQQSLEELKRAHEKEDSAETDQEIRELQAQLAKANLRLSLMSEGVRLVASQIRHADLNALPMKCSLLKDDQTISTVADSEISWDDSGSANGGGITITNTATTTLPPPANHMDLRLGEISQALSQSQTADLLALQNAAHMLQEHAQFSSQEASLAVQDSVEAQRSEQAWKHRARHMAKTFSKVQAENTELTERNKRLETERRVLVKEVRKLRKEQVGKQSYWTQFEAYVLEAMRMHEGHMKKMPQEASDDFSAHSFTSDENEGIHSANGSSTQSEPGTYASDQNQPRTPQKKRAPPASPAGLKSLTEPMSPIPSVSP